MLSRTSRHLTSRRYRGLMVNKRVVLLGLGTKIVPFLLRLFPRGFVLAGCWSPSAAKAQLRLSLSRFLTRRKVFWRLSAVRVI